MLAVFTPSNPGYYFGNYFILSAAPDAGDFARLQAEFDSAFRNAPDVRHAAFAFPGGMDERTRKVFADAGYTIEDRVVMIAERIVPFDPPGGVRIRPLLDERDLEAHLDMQMASRPPEHEETAYRVFMERQIEHRRALVDEIGGVWLGAFAGQALAGSCGIFPVGGEAARFQDVIVHPDYRRRGVASALVSAAGAWALERFGVRTLIIVAKSDAPARRLYERIGFTAMQHETALWKARR